MDDETDETNYMTPEQARSIQEALGELRANVVPDRPVPGSGRLATTLVTQAMRQCCLAMAAALQPADNDDGLDENHATVAGHAWATLAKLGPVFMRTLPPKYHFE